MTPIYYVRDWPQHFDCAEARKIKRLTWIKLPIRLDDVNYIRLVTGKHGSSRFGVWCALLELSGGASPRGVLLGPSKVPLSEGDLSTLTRIHHNSMKDALSALVEIGWLKMAAPGTDAYIRIASGEHPDDVRTASGADETRGDEDETKRRKERSSVAFSPSFVTSGNGGLRPLQAGRSMEWDGCVRLIADMRLDAKAVQRLQNSPVDDCSLYRLLTDARKGGVRNPSAYIMGTLSKMEGPL